jgi:glutathione S-transferase
MAGILKMKLYWGPHTCAIGIHILLEEAGARYETEKIDVAGGGTRAEEFLRINPRARCRSCSATTARW